MIEIVDVPHRLHLEDYAGYAYLRAAVSDLMAVATVRNPALSGRRIWMVNSTAKGGGVAEMLPKDVTLLRDAGLDTQWAVIHTDEPRFFALTKRLHNLIHGVGDPDLSADDRALYHAVSERLAAELSSQVGPDDIVVAHDPQTAALGALLKQRVDVPLIWRCHIGLDAENAQTRAAWSFLQPFVSAYDRAVFSAPEYIPSYLAGCATVIYPGIDPLSHKNRDLSLVKTMGISCNAGLVKEYAPIITPPFPDLAQRLRPDGCFGPLSEDEFGLLFRPVIAQISRWDRLKGFRPLLEGFCELKRRARAGEVPGDERQQRRLEIVRLVLAGPDPMGVQDDPEAIEVFSELTDLYQALEPSLQTEVAMLLLPMQSVKFNALMVNVLQRAASVVVQNSLEEGFGLTVTEAMWKKTAVLGSSACGIRQQIRHGIDGMLIAEPGDPRSVADGLSDILSDLPGRQEYGRNAQRRVHDEFLIFTKLRKWIELVWEVACAGPRRRPGRSDN